MVYKYGDYIFLEKIKDKLVKKIKEKFEIRIKKLKK